MEKIQLNLQLTQEDIQTAISRYHYQDTDLPLFFQVYEEVRKYLDPEGYYVYSGPDRERIGNRIWKATGEKAKKETQKETQKETKKETGGRAEEEAGVAGAEDNITASGEALMLPGGKHGFCQVIVTLGSGPDRLQEGYAAKGMLTESYMAECICTELLWKAYEELNEKIRGKYGLFVEKMLFPGSELPLEAMEGMFSQIGQTTVSFNRFYVLSPKKSVVYQARLGDTACTELCSSCGNKDCPNRKTAICEKEREDVGMKLERGLIHLYTGEGKGKTTAAMGLALRAAGSGKKVLIVQFMKGRDTGELHSLARIPEIRLLRSEKDFGFFSSMTLEQKEELTEIHNRILEEAILQAQEGKADVLVMDEVTYPVNWGLLDGGRLKDFLLHKPEAVEVVCTGRDAPAFLTDAADYITEMRCVRHPYQKGIMARKGIEF